MSFLVLCNRSLLLDARIEAGEGKETDGRAAREGPRVVVPSGWERGGKRFEGLVAAQPHS